MTNVPLAKSKKKKQEFLWILAQNTIQITKNIDVYDRGKFACSLGKACDYNFTKLNYK